MSAMGFYGRAESFFSGLHEVRAAAAVHVYVYTAGDYISAFGVYYFVGGGKSVAVVQYIKDCGPFDYYRAVFYPSVGCQNLTIKDLGSHWYCVEVFRYAKEIIIFSTSKYFYIKFKSLTSF